MCHSRTRVFLSNCPTTCAPFRPTDLFDDAYGDLHVSKYQKFLHFDKSLPNMPTKWSTSECWSKPLRSADIASEDVSSVREPSPHGLQTSSPKLRHDGTSRPPPDSWAHEGLLQIPSWPRTSTNEIKTMIQENLTNTINKVKNLKQKKVTKENKIGRNEHLVPRERARWWKNDRRCEFFWK